LAQNEDVSVDLRVLRTRKMLKNALIELTIEKGFPAVTVGEIADRAMVNRSTFYRHYQDKYDLLDKYMDDLYAILDTDDKPDAPTEPPAGLVRMLEHVQNHADFYRVMLGKKGVPGFAHRIRIYIERRTRASLSTMMTPDQLKSPSIDLCLKYISSASVGAMEWWLENDKSYTPEQMATLAVQLSTQVEEIFLSL
jgi:AcrR family transcriptional regulator